MAVDLTNYAPITRPILRPVCAASVSSCASALVSHVFWHNFHDTPFRIGWFLRLRTGLELDYQLIGRFNAGKNKYVDKILGTYLLKGHQRHAFMKKLPCI
ncbi:hypothetical protein O6H91_Y198000 [Diphasiastrum complanatum]|nr:hypothetical protein O6H91_Y198000 [Diphasiastrum complanatum]